MAISTGEHGLATGTNTTLENFAIVPETRCIATLLAASSGERHCCLWFSAPTAETGTDPNLGQSSAGPCYACLSSEFLVILRAQCSPLWAPLFLSSCSRPLPGTLLICSRSPQDYVLKEPLPPLLGRMFVKVALAICWPLRERRGRAGFFVTCSFAAGRLR
jgi:hypothetical protein